MKIISTDDMPDVAAENMQRIGEIAQHMTNEYFNSLCPGLAGLFFQMTYCHTLARIAVICKNEMPINETIEANLKACEKTIHEIIKVIEQNSM